MTKVCVFAGAGGSAALIRDAYTIGYNLAELGCHVYYGGSKRGVMGGLANGFVEGHGRNLFATSADFETQSANEPTKRPALTGVLPESIARLKHYDPAIDLVVTPDMPSRKAVFWQCDAFLCLPGGIGTCDELFEIWTHVKLGHERRRPIVVYNPAGFWDPLKQLLKNMMWHGTCPADRASLVQFTAQPIEAVSLVTAPVGAEHVQAKEE
jgi:uncharacterized protein (TIGR00730 family)